MKKVNNFGYQVFRPLFKLFLIITGNPKIINKNYIPKKDGCILVCNHTSLLDPIILGDTTHRSIHFLAKKELMDGLLGPILRFMGIIRVDRSVKNPDAKIQALTALEENKVVAIFPEGTRNRESGLKEFKFGAVSFAQKSGKPIIPMVILKKPTIFKKSIVLIGKPIYIKNTDDLEIANNRLRKIMLDLLK